MSDLQEGSYIPGYEEEFGGDTTFLDDGESGYGGDTETTMLDMSGARKAYLVREGTGERIQITNSKFAIGRKKGGVDYYVTGHTSVSRTHAVILSQEGHYFVIDLNSSNKTYVGGVEIAPNVEREIVSGTRIRFADVDFIFKID
ncbi:MAG: FHA domain-containing protein [Clostridiales Family XIII bacterium]|jgi:hypothetical protein|nr:FHA domain-containing protein [Clostridiales Family XIII bacterium]